MTYIDLDWKIETLKNIHIERGAWISLGLFLGRGDLSSNTAI